MTREEKRNRMITLQNWCFYLWMKDHWTPEDFENERQWSREWTQLEKELAN